MKKILILCLSVLVFSCNTAKKDLEKTIETNTVTAYSVYLQKYPEDIIAKQMIDSLIWLKISNSSDKKQYLNYLSNFPDGKNADQARIKIGKIPSFFWGNWIISNNETSSSKIRLSCDSLLINSENGITSYDKNKFTISEDGLKISFISNLIIAKAVFYAPSISLNRQIDLIFNNDNLTMVLGKASGKINPNGLLSWKGGVTIERKIENGKIVTYASYPEEKYILTKE